MDKKISALIALMLTAPVGCQYRGLTGKRPTNYELMQYKGVLESLYNTSRLESQRLEYLIPPTFAYPDGDTLGDRSKETISESLKKATGPEGSLLIPGQFSVSKIISAQEQQRAIEQEADEKLYRRQSDPAYYEKAKREFQAEYKRRMSTNILK